MNPFRAILGLVALILTLVLLIIFIPIFLAFIIVLIAAGLIIGLVMRIASIGRKAPVEEKPAAKRARKEKEKIVDAEFEEKE